MKIAKHVVQQSVKLFVAARNAGSVLVVLHIVALVTFPTRRLAEVHLGGLLLAQ